MKVGDRITAIIGGSAPDDYRTGTVIQLTADRGADVVPIDWKVYGTVSYEGHLLANTAVSYMGHWLLRSEEGIAWIASDDPTQIAALRTAYALRKGTL